MITSATNTVQYFLNKIKETEKTVQGELYLIGAWKGQLVDLIDLMKGTHLIDLVELDKDSVVNMITNLKEACQNYIDFKIPRDYLRV